MGAAFRGLRAHVHPGAMRAAQAPARQSQGSAWGVGGFRGFFGAKLGLGIGLDVFCVFFAGFLYGLIIGHGWLGCCLAAQNSAFAPDLPCSGHVSSQISKESNCSWRLHR